MTPAEKALKLEADQNAIKLYNSAWDSYLKRTGQTEETIKQVVEEARKLLIEK